MNNSTGNLYRKAVTWLGDSSSKTVIGFSRSLLAAGLLLKLVFNDMDALITPQQLQNLDPNALSYRCNFFLLFDVKYLAYMQVLAILILAITMAGYFIKITGLLNFWIATSIFIFRPGATSAEGIEMLLSLLLVPVCLADARKNHWHNPVEINYADRLTQDVFLFFIKLQVAFIYYDSLYDKLFIKAWLNGSVIYYWFTHNFFGLHPSLLSWLSPVLTNVYFLLLLAWASLAFEAVMALALFFPQRIKLILLRCGVMFHFGILLVHGYVSLFFVMSAALFLYLYPPKKSFSLSLFNE